MSGEYWVARLKAGDDRAELPVDDNATFPQRFAMA
jgi:hypothetical protein